MESTSQWIVLAHVLRPQGRKGEVLADLFTDFPERFSQRPQVWLARPGFAEDAATGQASGQEAMPIEVASHWLPVGRNAGRIVLHFAGIDSIGKAQELAGKDVLVPLADRMPLAPGAAYISDLIGCVVFDGEERLGVLERVEFPATPDGLRRLEEAAPLLAIQAADGSEILVPFAKAYLVGIDTAAKAVHMTLPDGLTEINRSREGSEKG